MTKSEISFVEKVVMVVLLFGVALIVLAIISVFLEKDVFDGCTNPRVITATSGYRSYRVLYVYECEDGRQISSYISPQDLRK